MNKKLSLLIWLVMGITLLACDIGQAGRDGQATQSAAVSPPKTSAAQASAATLAPRPTSTPTTQPTTVPYILPDGWRDYSVSNFTIALPERWEAVDVDKEGIEAVQADLKAIDAEWAKNTSQMLEAESMQAIFKFWAMDPEPAGMGNATLNVTYQPSPLRTKATNQATQMEWMLEKMGVEVVGVQGNLTINGLDAARLTVRAPLGNQAVKEYVYVFVQEHKQWTVSSSADESVWTDYEPIFRTAAESFRTGPAKATPTPPPAAANSLKVGLLASANDAGELLVESTQDGVTLAVAEWNARGGVLGRPVELVAEGSQCAPEPAAAAAEEVIDRDGVKFIISDICTSASLAISEIANARQVVQISSDTIQPAVTVGADGRVKPYTFRACVTVSYQGAAAARFALETLRARTAFIVTLDRPNEYVSGLAEGFEKVFIDGGGRVVGKEPLKMTAPDFPALVSKVADARPDVLYLPQTSLDANAVGTQVKQRGLDVVMLGGDGWNLPGLDPAAAEGGYFTDTYAADEPRAAVQSWLKKYEAEYGAEPLPGAALGYDAATMLFTAIENAGSADPVKVKDALATLKDFEAVTGKTSMDAQHNPLKSVVIFHVTQGKVEYSTSVAP